MKATLYKLKEGYVLCSDEEIREGDNFYHPKGVIFPATPTYLKGPVSSGIMKKVLTQSPDFSLLSEEDAKRIGWFDWKRYFDLDNTKYGATAHSYYLGFKKHAELTSDRMFTEEDVRKCYQWAVDNVDADGCLIDDEEVDFKDFIQSLSQPKSWQVTISEENGVYKVLSVS